MADWVAQLAERGTPDNAASEQPEIWRAVDSGSSDVPVFSVPGVVHGRIARAAQIQMIGVRVERPEELVLEIETPQATLPRFNPVVRLLDADGNEMVTNVYTKRNNNGLYMMKMIQAKSTVSLRSPGLYRLEIHDITTDCAGEDFEYKVYVRRGMPHLGRITVAEAQINLLPDSVAELHLTAEREEGFAGTVAFEIDGLPAGVSVVPALAKPVDRPPLPNGGRLERYAPKSQSAVLLLAAAADAPSPGAPVLVRLFARPVVDGKPGKRIPVTELPLLVLAGGSS
jgi:hypothetical protein